MTNSETTREKVNKEATDRNFLRAVDWMKDPNGIEVDEKHYRRIGLIAEDLYNHIICHNRAIYAAESKKLNFWETLETEFGNDLNLMWDHSHPEYWNAVVRNLRMMIHEFIPDVTNTNLPITSLFHEAKLIMLHATIIDPDTDHEQMINQYFVPLWCGSAKDLYCKILLFLYYKDINATNLSLIDIAFIRVAFEVGLHIGALLHYGSIFDSNNDRISLGKSAKSQKKTTASNMQSNFTGRLTPKQEKTKNNIHLPTLSEKNGHLRTTPPTATL